MKKIFKTFYFLQEFVNQVLISLCIVITYSMKFGTFFSMKRGLISSQFVKLKVKDQANISCVNLLSHDVAGGISGGNVCV